MRRWLLMLNLIAMGAVAAVPAFADSFVLEGNNLRVGVGSSGALVDDSIAVVSSGLLGGHRGAVGVQYRGVDLIMPGTPFQFYAIGADGQYGIASNDGAVGNSFATVTTNTSSGGRLSALTTGSYGAIGFTQKLSFDKGAYVISYDITLTNAGTDTLSDVVFATGFDPDQDYSDFFEAFETENSIRTGMVNAYGPNAGWGIAIVGDGNATISSSWDTDPYLLLTPINDGYGDNTINMGWRIGDLAAGQSATISYDYAITDADGNVVPEPSTMILLGSGLTALVVFRKKFRRTPKRVDHTSTKN